MNDAAACQEAIAAGRDIFLVGTLRLGARWTLWGRTGCRR